MRRAGLEPVPVPSESAPGWPGAAEAAKANNAVKVLNTCRRITSQR